MNEQAESMLGRLMTDEQAKQYEICKTRKHETDGERGDPHARNTASTYQNQQISGGLMQQCSPWKTCRWCGTQYQEVQETRQVEKA